jgi:hypothetical protein
MSDTTIALILSTADFRRIAGALTTQRRACYDRADQHPVPEAKEAYYAEARDVSVLQDKIQALVSHPASDGQEWTCVMKEVEPERASTEVVTPLAATKPSIEELLLRDPRDPKDAEGWELYTADPRPGVSEAGVELCKALDAAKRAALPLLVEALDCRDAGSSRQSAHRAAGILSAAYMTHMAPALKKHSNHGAMDTEPRANAMEALNRLANRVGFYGRIDF